MSKLKDLSSFALMSINWEENKKDFIDLLKPFILFSINPPSNEIISIYDVSLKIKKEFGISIPKNLIEVVLNRLVKEKILEKNDYKYKYVVGYNLSKDVEDFTKNRKEHIKNQECIIDEFMYFCKERLNLNFKREAAENIILNYLEKYSHNIFLEINMNHIDIKEDSNYIMGKFIDYLVEEKKSIHSILEKIIKGFLIASSMYSSNIEIDKSKMKFKNTSIFFDTTFLFYAFGYSGKELESSCIELLELLLDLGAELKVHEHVVFEIKSILEAYINLYENNRLHQAYNFEYLIDNNKTSTDIMLYISNITRDLNALNIRSEETPEYRKDNVFISHIKLEEHLENEINYSSDNKEIAIKNDVESISAIYRIRNGKSTRDIEDCKAIFMTTNASLVRAVNSYIKKENQLQNFPPIITDINLTGIAWLKLPHKYPDLPKKYIIADAYSLQQPNSKFWEAYLKKVENLLEEETITEEDALMLKYVTSKKDLMDITYGSEEKLSHNCMMKLLEKIKSKKQRELEKELGEKKLEIEGKRLEIEKKDEYREKEKTKIRNSVYEKSDKYASYIVEKHHKRIILSKVVINVILIIGQFILLIRSIESERFVFKIILIFSTLYFVVKLIIDLASFNKIDKNKKYSAIYEKNFKQKKAELESILD